MRGSSHKLRIRALRSPAASLLAHLPFKRLLILQREERFGQERLHHALGLGVEVQPPGSLAQQLFDGAFFGQAQRVPVQELFGRDRSCCTAGM